MNTYTLGGRYGFIGSVVLVLALVFAFSASTYAQEATESPIVIEEVSVTSTIDESAPVEEETAAPAETVVKETDPPTEEAVSDPIIEEPLDQQVAPTEEVVTEETVPAEGTAVEEVASEPVVEEVISEPAVEPTVEEPVPTEETSQIVIEDVSISTTLPLPTLTTDKDDYAPGETATIWGKFFGALQNVVLTIVGVAVDGSTAVADTWGTVADNVGSFTTSYTLPNIYVPRYLLAANADTGEVLAETTFTDDAPSVLAITCGNVSVNGTLWTFDGTWTAIDFPGLASQYDVAMFSPTGTLNDSSSKDSLDAFTATSTPGANFAGAPKDDMQGTWHNEIIFITPPTSVSAALYHAGVPGNEQSGDSSCFFTLPPTTTPVVVTASSHTIAYGAAVPTITPSYSPSASPATSPICTTTATASSPVGTYPSTCSGASDPAHTFSYIPGTVTITKADPTCIVTPYSVTYDGSSHTATGSCTGVASEPLSGLVLTNTTHTNAADYVADPWSFTDVTGNYNDTSGTVHDVIAQAPSTTVVTCPNPTEVYTGNPIEPCTASYTTVDDSGPLTVSYTANTNVGIVTASAAYVGDTNHEGSDDSTTFEITKAPSTVTVTCPASVTYTGSAQEPCTAEATGAGMSPVAVTASLVYTNNTNAGSATADASWSGDANHTGGVGAGGFTIGKANAVITVTPYDVTYDAVAHTALGTATGVESPTPADLSSLLDLSGTTHTNVGDYTSDTWSFAGNSNYNSASGTVHDKIAKANAICSVSGYTGIYDATVHGATGSCSGIGGEDAGALDLGASFTDVPGGIATWSFANPNYVSQNGTVDIVISKAPSTVTVTCVPDVIAYTGSEQTPCTAKASGVGMSDVNVTSSLGYSPDNINPGLVTATATWDGDSNHTGNTGSATFTIYGLTTTDALTAYNLIGTEHTFTVKVTPSVAGVPVLFGVTGVNPLATTSPILTDGDGNAKLTYTDSVGGIDYITACLNLDGDLACDSSETTITQTKYWLTKFLTGGGNVRTGKGNSSLLWTFGGNVGLAGDNTPVGQFQVQDHNGFGYHFNNILSVALTGLQTFTFTASGWTQGSTKAPVTATITVVDGNVGGRDKGDKIGVTITDPDPDLIVIPTLKGLTGGNLKVFVR